jgi:uncharacterized membrane protein
MLEENAQLDVPQYVEVIKSMVKDGSLRVEKPSYEISSILDYLFTVTVSGEFSCVFLLAVASGIMTYLLPTRFPLNIFRMFFGAVLIFLPGYSTAKLLFPVSHLGFPERFALSAALSLAIVPIIGFALNFTPLGINLQPIIVSIAAYSLFVICAAGFRNYLELVQVPGNHSGEGL